MKREHLKDFPIDINRINHKVHLKSYFRNKVKLVGLQLLERIQFRPQPKQSVQKNFIAKESSIPYETFSPEETIADEKQSNYNKRYFKSLAKDHLLHQKNNKELILLFIEENLITKDGNNGKITTNLSLYENIECAINIVRDIAKAEIIENLTLYYSLLQSLGKKQVDIYIA